MQPTFLVRGLRRGHLIALDVVLALALTLLAATAGWDHEATRDFTGPDWLAALVALGLGAPVAVRRLWPMTALAAVFALLAVATVTGLAWGQSGIPFLLPMAFVLYTLGLLEPRRRSVMALVACLAVTTSMIVFNGGQPWATAALLVFDWLLLLVAPWAAGRAIRLRRAYAANSAEQLARSAVTDERLRIARELHDIVAHSLSLITVKAAIANHVAAQHPDEAREALRIIEDTSRDTLTEMRRLLGVLRSDSTVPELAPTPGLAGLASLADRAALAGVRVDLEVRGQDRLPDGVELSIYRIVQEALTNVVRHAAPARCRVRVDADGREARVEIVDDGPGVRTLPGTAQGHGIIGMRERVMMYDGDFTAGPRPEGGFAVSARLPFGLTPEPA